MAVGLKVTCTVPQRLGKFCGHIKRRLCAHINTRAGIVLSFLRRIYNQCPEVEDSYLKLMKPFKSVDLTSADNIRELSTQMQSFLVHKLNVLC